MEPQFQINLGGLDKLGFTEKEFLELFDINLKKAVPANKEFKCPKCKRGKEDVYFTYYKYQDFKFGKDIRGGNADYSFVSTNFYLCICGCLYCDMTEASRMSAKKR